MLLVANMFSNNIVAFKVDCNSGLLNDDDVTITTSDLLIKPSFILPVYD